MELSIPFHAMVYFVDDEDITHDKSCTLDLPLENTSVKFFTSYS